MARRKLFSGTLEVELTSADLEGALERINHAGIIVYNAEQVGDLSARFTIERPALRKTRRIIAKRGDSLTVRRKCGLYWNAKRLTRRPVLVLGLCMILFLSWYLPGKILFITVEGNQHLPDALILERAEECGIRFYASRREVRSEKMKNALLSAMPELEWAGVNTYGCRAVISVRERGIAQNRSELHQVSSVVASVDGVIRELTVIQGNPVCKVGQSVTAGQVLISGYTDLGLCIRAEQAQGEVFAQTQRTLQVISLAEYAHQGQITGAHKNFSLLIGKKRINFFKGSGISDTSCDKMYSYYYLTLPGGFRLPVTLVEEAFCYATMDNGIADAESARELASDFASKYLSQIMVAGKIETRYEAFTPEDDLYRLSGKYACYEMIGKTRTEESFNNYETNGTEH